MIYFTESFLNIYFAPFHHSLNLFASVRLIMVYNTREYIFRKKAQPETVEEIASGWNGRRVLFTRIYDDPSFRPTICGTLVRDGGGFHIRVGDDDGKQVTIYRDIDKTLLTMEDRDHNGIVPQIEYDQLIMVRLRSMGAPEDKSVES
jgi:hypothetical protein